MNGYNIAEAGHVVNMLPAVSTSSGKTTLPVNMANYEHLSIIISYGSVAAQPTSFIVRQATTEAIGASKAMGFRFYLQATGGAGNDTLTGPFYADTTGITSSLPASAPLPAACSNLVWVIEIDAAELEVQAGVVGTITEYPYVYVVIADGVNANIGSVIGILSGARYGYKGSPSATV